MQSNEAAKGLIMRIRIVVMLLLVLTATVLLGQNGNDLFQQALKRQTADADIRGAIPIYERIVRDFASNRALVARALVELGKCYESLGQAESEKYYQQVVDQYADQVEMVAQAKSRLAAAATATSQVST